MVPARILIVFVLAIGQFSSPYAIASTCDIDSSDTVATSIATYQDCIDSGHQMVASIRTELGAKAFKKKDYETAVLHFSEIIGQQEQPGKAHFNRALAYLELGKKRKALKDLEATNQLLPGYSAAHFYRGVVLDQLRRYQQAVDAHNIALNLSAGGTALAPIYYEKSQSELAHKNKPAAIESLTNAIVADPNYSRAYFARALRHEKNDANELAIADYSQYLKLKPESSNAYYNRGLIYREMRRDHLAIQDFDQAIALNPRYVKARASKGITYLWPVLPVLFILLMG
ncbi:MAG: tetratricopeptide (TPR) repeat protein [Candidatus Azotimanducaceae bacterium]|jgi:tetratricopeptide (TPR) repeat protein